MPMVYGLRFFCTSNPFLWQVALSIVHLLCAIFISIASTNLFGWLTHTKDEALSWSGVTAGILWLVFPWSLGFSAWSVMLPPLIGVLFAIIATVFITKPDARFIDSLISMVLFCLSWSIYEATWFIWFPISIIRIARDFHLKKSLREGLRFLFLASFLQLIFVGLNRYLSAQVQHAKRVSWNIIPTLNTNIHLFKNQLLPLIGSGISLVIIGFIVLIILAILNSYRSNKIAYSSLTFILLFFGLCLSIILYAFAGYAIEWIGLFGRVTLPLSFWFVLLSSCLFSLCLRKSNKFFEISAWLGFLLICCPLAYSLIQNSILWNKSWVEQQEIMATINEPVMKLVNEDSIILMDIPRGTDPVNTFSSFWDITGAVVSKIKNFTRPKKIHAYASVLRLGEWRTTWDGKNVKQYWCTSPDTELWSLDAKKVYSWKYLDEKPKELMAPFDIGCGI